MDRGTTRESYTPPPTPILFSVLVIHSNTHLCPRRRVLSRLHLVTGYTIFG